MKEKVIRPECFDLFHFFSKIPGTCICVHFKQFVSQLLVCACTRIHIESACDTLNELFFGSLYKNVRTLLNQNYITICDIYSILKL